MEMKQEYARYIEERERRVHDDSTQRWTGSHAAHVKSQKPAGSDDSHQQGGVDQINNHGEMIHHQTLVRVRQSVE